MKIKDIVIYALRLVGRDDVSAVLDSGQQAEGECAHAAETMLYCVNAVEDELARCYFPLVKKETRRVASGKVSFSALDERPVKILGLTSGNKPLEFKLTPQYIEINAVNAEIEYMYTPAKKDLDGSSAYGGTVVGESLIASGAAAEYCILNGENTESELWEKRYRRAIDKARSLCRKHYGIPPRRWV